MMQDIFVLFVAQEDQNNKDDDFLFVYWISNYWTLTAQLLIISCQISILLKVASDTIFIKNCEFSELLA
jgi:hypothetical protein